MQKPMRTADILAALSSHEWFNGLPAELRDAILALGHVRKVCSGELIFAQGDSCNGLFAVLEGTVRLSGTTAEGKPIMYRMIGAGGWFGHLSALDGGPRVQDAHTLQDGHLLHLSRSGFDSLLSEDPARALHFARLICRDIRISMNMMAEFQTATITRRIGMMVLEMCNEKVRHNLTDQPLTQETLAAFTGTTRQTVNRILRKWERQGLITIDYGSIRIHDFPAFERFLDEQTDEQRY